MSLQIVFMGTPDFAVASLKALVEAGENIVGVITAPDKPQGRGKQLGESAVKKYALEKKLNILQPTNLKASEFIEDLMALKADLQVVVAFRMLPEVVWAMPPKGTFNLHASLLPQYRGAAPINWAVINGEKETGVTTFFLKHEIDTGGIIIQEKMAISENDSAGTVHARLMEMGAQLVVKTVQAVTEGNVEPKNQDESGPIKHAPKIFKGDCKIDWNKTTEEIHNFVRGLSPYPSAWSEFHGSTLKIFKTEKSTKKIDSGLFLKNGSDLLVGTGDGSLLVQELQLEGKRRMSAEDFLKGYRWSD